MAVLVNRRWRRSRRWRCFSPPLTEESKPLAVLLMPSTAEYGPVSELLPPA